MKKLLTLLVALFMIGFLASCSNDAPSNNEGSDPDTVKVVSTVFPQHDWITQILGEDNDNVETRLLLENGVDLHSYQPSVQDIATISDCDLFIYTGGESEEWVEDALANASNKNMIVVNLLDVLGDKAKLEEIKEGMNHDHDDDHSEDTDHDELHANDEDSHDHDDEDLDEHVWLSLNNAELFVMHLSDKLSELDPDNSATYSTNAEAYCKELAALSERYKAAINSANYDTVLFGDRFPFRYLVDDYNLDYFAAFPGCAAETEASFETIVFLANKMDDLGLDSICTIESSDDSMARTIIENTTMKDQQIITFDSMQSVTSSDIAQGTTYLSLMEYNLDRLKEAIGA